ncbi:hypothetical protein TrVE_jg5147 [Triparma verrucosa]|uniref:Membrane insertase YidC/Oxa/ALB C-terminal domain-containing protein n=1 Tax=Triparma verrucosa TaxID=1606542 RepID=A0A9W7BCT3_9STRA|nr:hypothetical protein TrVE_jg5147 [Triparma verrucosa]
MAEAVAAVGETEKNGWWEQYLQIFKTGLLIVHDNLVDPPLAKMGVEHTWGVSIATFTLFVRSALVPLSFQQTKSAEYMKALKPYQTEIKEKFADNKDMQNRALSKLFEDANQNPLAGCFISLLQLPIFLGLYRSVTILAKEGKIDEGFLWIPSLQGPVEGPTFRGMDWLTGGGKFPWEWHPTMGWEAALPFLIMPVALVLLQSFTMSVLTPAQDKEGMTEEEAEQLESSQRVLKFLPLMIGYFSLQVPAGLTIYWATSNLFSLLQTTAVKQYYKLNPPEIELPDYWDALDDVANMSDEDRREAAKAGISTGPKFEDLMDEAKFHVVVDREQMPLRAESVSWKKVKGEGGGHVAEQFKSWGVKSVEIVESAVAVE